MTESKVDVREQFEAWISDGGEGGAFFGKPRLEVDGENEFIDPDTYGAWLTWQAALRSPAASPKHAMARADAEISEVWVVQDESGLPIYCASYPESCHEHINDAINEHGIEEARAWKVLRFGNYVFVPCRECNSTRVAIAALAACTPAKSEGR